MKGERETVPPMSQVELEDQAHELLAASSVPGMECAAQKLRQTALNVRRRLAEPALVNGFQPAPTVLDPESHRMELADLAIDVVTSIDYLLTLVASRPTSQRLMLSGEATSYRGEGSTGDDVHERLTRRRLDARGAAVRLSMRLAVELRGNIASA
jgi:hypothetical protein